MYSLKWFFSVSLILYFIGDSTWTPTSNWYRSLIASITFDFFLSKNSFAHLHLRLFFQTPLKAKLKSDHRPPIPISPWNCPMTTFSLSHFFIYFIFSIVFQLDKLNSKLQILSRKRIRAEIPTVGKRWKRHLEVHRTAESEPSPSHDCTLCQRVFDYEVGLHFSSTSRSMLTTYCKQLISHIELGCSVPRITPTSHFSWKSKRKNTRK